MSTEWIQSRRDELLRIIDTVRVNLEAPSNKHWWCPRCHSQLHNNDAVIEKHLFACKLKDIVPHPENIHHDATPHQFYYTNCPAVVSLLQPPQRMTRDYTAELMHHRAAHQPRAPTERHVQLSDMVVEHQSMPAAPVPVPVPETTNTLLVHEYAVSTQGRGDELMAPGTPRSTDQLVKQRVNQFCAALWQEQQSLAARSQFYEAVEWTARAEREQSGVASIDAQALEDWLQRHTQLQTEQKRARQEQERDQRSRPEKFRAKNLITKKRPAELQRDLVQLLFGQISDAQPRDSQTRDTPSQSRDSEQRERHRERDQRDYHRSDREREYDRDHDRRSDRDHDRDYDRRGDRDSDRDYEREYDRRGDRDTDRDYDRHRERREDHYQDRKRRHESSAEYEGHKRQRYR